jgi:hypothetical protein
VLAWLLWHLERIERIHAVARSLISEFGVEAYAEARQRERAARRDRTAREWRRVALVVARRASVRAGADGATRPALPEVGFADEAARFVSEHSQLFRIQFVCGTLDRGPRSLTEKQIRAVDTSAAIVAAAKIQWPPQTIGLRILDRDGREVFAREKAVRRSSNPAKASAPAT